MATQSLLAKAGLRLTTLGSSVNLAVAAPLAEGSESTAAATDATRIGWFASRTPLAEQIGLVVMGTERLAATVAGATITGVATVTGAASIGAGVTAAGAILTTSGAITAKPVGLAGIAIDPNGSTGNFTVSIVPPAVLTADRTLTLLDASGTIVASTGLTSGRVPYASGGLLTDSALLTYDATLATGGLTVANTSASTSPTSGALLVTGGIGTSDAVNAAGQITAFSGTGAPVDLWSDGVAGQAMSVGVNNTVISSGTKGPVIIGANNTGARTSSTAQVVVGSNITGRANDTNTLLMGMGYSMASVTSGANVICIANGGGPGGNISSSIIIGRVSAVADNSVIIGRLASAGSAAAVVGNGATATGTGSIALGQGANAGAFTNAGAIGQGAAASANNQLAIGSATSGLQLFVRANIASTNPLTGALVVFSGVGIGTDLFVGATINSASFTNSTSTSTGAIVAPNGGLGLGGAIFAGGNITTTNGTAAGVFSTTALTFTDTLAPTASLRSNATTALTFNSLVVAIPLTTTSTSSTTGALTVAGGLGVAGAAYVGGYLVPRGGSGAGSFNTVVGIANAPGNNLVVIGDGAGPTSSTAVQGVFIGRNAVGSGDVDNVVALGYGCTAGSNDVVVIGSGASATGAAGVAIGRSASSTVAGQIVLGAAGVHTSVSIPMTTAATSSTTGALLVTGGVGVTGNLYSAGTANNFGSASTVPLTFTAGGVPSPTDAALRALSTNVDFTPSAAVFGRATSSSSNGRSKIGVIGLATVGAGQRADDLIGVYGRVEAVLSGQAVPVALEGYATSSSVTTANTVYGVRSTAVSTAAATAPDVFGGSFTAVGAASSVIAYGIYATASGAVTNYAGYFASGLVTVASTTATSSTVTGALTIAGGVGIAGALYLGASLSQVGIAAPAVSAAGQGRIYFDSSLNVFRASQNGGAYVDLIGGGGGSGTVTSVGLSLPGIFSVSGSPVTTTGTLTATLATQTANTVFAGPTTGGAAAPTFRSLVAADIPTLSPSTITGGTASTVALFSGVGALTSSADFFYSFSGGSSVSLNSSSASTSVNAITSAASGDATFAAGADAGNASFGHYGSTSPVTITGLALASKACVFADLDLVLHAGDASSSANIYITNFSGIVATFNGGALSAGSLDIAYTKTSTSTTTGALTVAGGAGIVGDVYIGGKLNVAGLIDPTGLALDPQSANPGGPLAASTIWVNSSDSNKLYFGASAVGGVGGSPAGLNTQVQYNNAGAFGASADFTWDNTGKTLTIGSSGVILMPETAVSAPAYSFTGHTNYGLRYKAGFSQICLTSAGADKIIIGGSGAATYFRNGVLDHLWLLTSPSSTDLGDFANSGFVLADQFSASGGSTLLGKVAALSASITGNSIGTSVIAAISARTRVGSTAPNVVLAGVYIDTTASSSAAYSFGLYQAGHMNNQVQGYFSMGGAGAGFTPGVSSSGEGRLYYDETANKFKVSENGGSYVDLLGGAGAPGGSDQQLQYNNAGSFGGMGYNYRTDSCDTVGSRGNMSTTFGYPATNEPAGVLFNAYGVADYNAESPWVTVMGGPGSNARCSSSLWGEAYDSSNLVDFFAVTSVMATNNFGYFPSFGIACLHLSTLGYYSFPVPFYGVYQAGAYMDNHFDGFITLGGSAPAVSAASMGRIYYDSSLQKFQASENGGAYVDLIGAGGGIAGADTEVQFNNSGVFGASSHFTFAGGTTLRMYDSVTAGTGTQPAISGDTPLIQAASGASSGVGGLVVSENGVLPLPRITGLSGTGSMSSPTATSLNNALLSVRGAGYTGSAYAVGGDITLRAAQTWTGSARGTYMALSTTLSGTTTLSEKLRLWDDGSLQLGGTFTAGLGAGGALFTGNFSLNSTNTAPTFTPTGRYAQIVSSATNGGMDLLSYGGTPTFTAHRADGTIASPTTIGAVSTGILTLSAAGWDGGGWKTAATILVDSAAAWTTSDHPARMTFSMSPTTGSSSAPTAVMRLWSSGGLVLGGTPLATDPGAGVLLLEGGLSLTGGANKSLGTATLVAGTVTVSNTRVTANSRIFLSVTTVGGVQGILSVGTITAGTSFVINSSNIADTSTVAWMIIESA